MPERRIFDNPWSQSSAIANLERRERMAAAAHVQATRDLVIAKERAAPRSDRKDVEASNKAAVEERARIRAIVCSEAGLKSPKAAFRLAFDGNLGASDAIALLEATIATKPAGPVMVTAAQILAAAKKARTPT